VPLQTKGSESRSSKQKTHLSSLLTGPLCPASGDFAGGLVRADIWLSGALGSPSGSQTTWGRRYRFCLCLAERGRGWVMKARQVWFCPPCCNHRERRLQSVRNAFEMETFEEVSERKRVFEALSAFFPPPFPPSIFFAYLKYRITLVVTPPPPTPTPLRSVLRSKELRAFCEFFFLDFTLKCRWRVF